VSPDRRDFQSLPYGLQVLADAALQVGQVALALAAATEGIDLIRQHSFWPFTAALSGPLAEALVLANVEDAEHQLEELERLAANHEQRGADPQFLRARGLRQWRRGELESAARTLQQSAAVAREQSAVIQCGRTLAVLAEVAASAGDERMASETMAELTDIVRGIGPEVGSLTWAMPQAPAAVAPVRVRYTDGLTQREVEVLRLISAGHSNAEIGERLVLSVRTVERHITNLYAKIGARGRADATAYAIRHHLA
jgi:DNA-binding CsgD family transcriptional regulator